MAFRRKPAITGGPVTTMLVGLGNPGSQYRGTRHNLGFRVIDELAVRLHTRVAEKQDGAMVGMASHPGGGAASVLLVKPQTYMNLSGRAAAPLLRRHGLKPGALWAVHDEMDIPFGKLRIREGGSAGGHNGMHSLISDLGTPSFPRFRLGVGRPPDGDDPVEFLLAAFDQSELEAAEALVVLAADAVLEALKEGMLVSMNRYNGRSVVA
ncbi:MAG: aminoacyl-tRNA hydrolase [Candidatus Dormibacteria bacterium]